jgi:hypothetical protein
MHLMALDLMDLLPSGRRKTHFKMPYVLAS